MKHDSGAETAVDRQNMGATPNSQQPDSSGPVLEKSGSLLSSASWPSKNGLDETLQRNTH